MPRPDLQRVPAFYHSYISKVREDDLQPALENSTESFLAMLGSIPPEKHHYRYADDKWTVKDLVQHVIDAERIFSYRALRIARRDTTPLPGFNEQSFASHANATARSWSGLTEEFSLVRNATMALFRSFSKEDLDATGVANNEPVYVLGIGFICAGHCRHHIQVLEERYLK